MSGERFSLDTNILVYSVDSTDHLRHQTAQAIVAAARSGDCCLTLQASSEFSVVVTRKNMVPPAEAAAQVEDWLDQCPAVPVGRGAVQTALRSATTGIASYWDGLLAATAAEAGCTVLLTEDMADGAVLHGVRVVHPFGPAGPAPGASAPLVPDAP